MAARAIDRSPGGQAELTFKLLAFAEVVAVELYPPLLNRIIFCVSVKTLRREMHAGSERTKRHASS